jgi:transcriptional regulator with XRE-family HTH domain
VTAKRAAKHSGEALRRYLRREKMTVTQFGKMGGWQVSTVSRWLNGQFPSDDQKASIAKITGGQVQPNDWFKGLPKKVRLTAQAAVDGLRYAAAAEEA